MSFLSQDNAQYINTILSDFLKDKHNINIYDGTLSEDDYKKLLANTMTFIYQTYNSQKINMNDMNKIVISELKDKIINIFNKAKDITPETDFINKLQKLELQRQNFNTSLPPPIDIKPADMVYNHPQSTSSPIQLPSISTVYLPNPTKMGIEVIISSWQRDWIYYPKRNAFPWKGPLPSQLDLTDVKIACIVLHKDIGIQHPLISIFIQGPNELDVHVSMLLDKISGEFSIYKPITTSLSMIYLLALPWIVTIESSDGEEIDLGYDKIPFSIISSSSHTTTISIQNYTFKQYDNLRLYFEHNKRILPSMVLNIIDNKIEISGVFQHNGYLLNYNRQITIILETHSILHKK